MPTLDLVSTVYWIILHIPPGHTSKLFDSKVIYLPERCLFGLFFVCVDFIMNNLSNTLYLL